MSFSKMVHTPNQTFSVTIMKPILCLQNNTKCCQFGSPMVLKGTQFQRFKIFSPFNVDIPFFEIPHFFFWFFHVVVLGILEVRNNLMQIFSNVGCIYILKKKRDVFNSFKKICESMWFNLGFFLESFNYLAKVCRLLIS